MGEVKSESCFLSLFFHCTHNADFRRSVFNKGLKERGFFYPARQLDSQHHVIMCSLESVLPGFKLCTCGKNDIVVFSRWKKKSSFFFSRMVSVRVWFAFGVSACILLIWLAHEIWFVLRIILYCDKWYLILEISFINARTGSQNQISLNFWLLNLYCNNIAGWILVPLQDFW